MREKIQVEKYWRVQFLLQKSLPAAKALKPVSKSASKDSIGSNQASSKASPEPEEVQPIKNVSESEQQQETEPEPATEPAAEADTGKEELPECDMTCECFMVIEVSLNWPKLSAASFTTRRIASEEEAKAALTERRRLMREQQEKEAQLAEEMRVSYSSEKF